MSENKKSYIDKTSIDPELILKIDGMDVRIDESKIAASDTAPEGIVEGRLWLDTSENEFQETVYDGYPEFKRDVARQLADMDEKVETVPLDNFLQVARSRYANKPLVTFVDDDGAEGVLTRLKPIFVAKKVPMVTALIGSSGLPTTEAETVELRRLIKEEGWEVAWHTHLHENLGTYTEAKLHEDFKKGLEFSKVNGFEIENLVYPYGSTSDLCKRVSSQYFKSAVGVTNNVFNDLNTGYIRDSYEIVRAGFASYATDDRTTYLDYKQKVDEAISTNSWLVFMTHIWHEDHNETQQRYLEDIIDYIKSQGVEIVTLKEGIKRKAPALEKGGVIGSDADHFAINPDGTIESNSGITYLSGQILDGTASIESFKKGKITINEFYNVGSVGTPTNVGILTTHRPKETDYLAIQTWQPMFSSALHTRTRTEFGWAEWSTGTGGSSENGNDEALVVRDTVALDGAASIEDFPKGKISIGEFYNTASDGTPSELGVLTTYRPLQDDVLSYQTFRAMFSTAVYVRTRKVGGWEPWDQVGGGSVSPLNSYTAASKPSEFPAMKVTLFSVNNPNSTGTPNGVGGTFTTTCAGGDGWDHQTFKEYGAFKMYIRHATEATSWSDWKQIQMVV